MSDALCARLQQQLVLSGTAVCFSSESIDLDSFIVEILSRLPAKSLLRFRCVCKAWRTMISDPYFARKHLSCINTKVSSSYSLLIKENVFRSIEHEAILNYLSQSTSDGPLPFRRVCFPVLNPPCDIADIKIIGSCNGLICLRFTCIAKQSYAFMVWNPCTGESNVLPHPPLHSCSSGFYGFGYDSTIDDYKVVLGRCSSDDECVVVVFSLKTGSWRKVERLDRYFAVHFEGYLVNEALYWVFREFKDTRFIGQRFVSFDLAEEKFHEIPLLFPPNPVDKDRLIAGIGVLNNCLTLYFQTDCCQPGCSFKMWVLRDNGVGGFWSEVVNIPVLDDMYIFMTCISKNGEVLMRMAYNDSLALYNPQEKSFRIVMNGNRSYNTAAYLETLVSP